jgi:hypothetical protein
MTLIQLPANRVLRCSAKNGNITQQVMKSEQARIKSSEVPVPAISTTQTILAKNTPKEMRSSGNLLGRTNNNKQVVVPRTESYLFYADKFCSAFFAALPSSLRTVAPQ